GLGDPAGGVAFAPGGTKLLLRGANRTELWDLDPGPERLVAGLPAPARGDELPFLGDGKTFVTGHPVRLWDLATGQERGVLDGEAFTASADGTTLATWSPPAKEARPTDAQVTVRGTATSGQRCRVRLAGNVTAVALSGD